MKTKILFNVIFLGVFLGGFCLSANAQQYSFESDSPAATAKYQNFDFGGQFVVQAETDPLYNYYLLDFTHLNSEFKVAYFLDLATNSGKIFLTRHGLTREKSWYKADKSIDENEILKLVNDLKRQTVQKDAALNEVEKTSWIKNKYQLNK